MRTLRFLAAVLALGAALATQAGAYDDKVYWIETHEPERIGRCNLDGSAVETVVDLPLTIGDHSQEGVAVDSLGGKLYWTQFDENLIQRANLDGTGVETIVDLSGQPPAQDITLDPVAGHIYWADNDGRIRRANTDGSDIQTLYDTGGYGPEVVALDTVRGKMYWTDHLDRAIYRANLDGTVVETVIASTLGSAIGLALDTSTETMYWAVFSSAEANGVVERAGFDGTNRQTVLTTDPNLNNIAIDVLDGKMYLTRYGKTGGLVIRANLDGTGEQVIVTGLGGPRGLALDVEPVPEPGTFCLLTLGGVALLRRKRKG